MSVFANAFSGGVWAALIIILVAGTLALSFVLGLESKLPHDASYAAKTRLHKIRNAGIKTDQKKIIEMQEHWDLSEILLVVIGAICQQGCARDPSTSAARILLLSLLFLATLVITAFSAVLVAGVSLQTPACFVEEESKSQPSILAQTFNAIDIPNSSYFTLKGGMTGVWLPSHTGGSLHSTNMSSTLTSEAGFREYPNNATSFAFKNNHSEEKRILSRSQLKELESGLTKRSHLLQIESNWDQLACQESELDSDSAANSLSITLSDVWPAIAQWIAGLVIAMILLIAELIYGPRFTQRDPDASDNFNTDKNSPIRSGKAGLAQATSETKLGMPPNFCWGACSNLTQ